MQPAKWPVHMKKALKKVLLFIIIPLPLVLLFDHIVDQGLHRSRAPYFAVWNAIYDSKINADLIVSGSSRAYEIVSPRILDSMLHLNCYNLGMDGWEFSMEYARMRIYLQHNKLPRYILQSIDLNMFFRRPNLYQFQQFIPYLKDPIIAEATSHYTGKFSPAERYLPLFRYNADPSLIAEGLKAYFGKGKVTTDYKGYQPTTKPWDTARYNRVKRLRTTGITGFVRPEAVAEFEEFVRYCTQHHIQLIFYYAPGFYEEYKIENIAPTVMNVVNGLSEKYGVPFLNYYRDSLCFDTSYFWNSYHLNKKGSEIFTAHLASDVKPLLH